MAAMNIHHLQRCHHQSWLPFSALLSLLFLIAASNLFPPAAAGRPIAELPASLLHGSPHPLPLLRLFWHIRMGIPVSSSLWISMVRKEKGAVQCSHGKEGEKDGSLQAWIGKEEEKKEKEVEEEEEEEEGRRWLNEKMQQVWGSNGKNPDVVNYKETNNNFNNNGSVSFHSEEIEGEKLPETNNAMKDHTTTTAASDAGQSTAPTSNANEDAPSPNSSASSSESASKPKDAGALPDSQSTTTPIASDGSSTASPPPNASNPSKSPDSTDLKTSTSTSDSGSQPGNPSKAGDGFSNPLSNTSFSNSKDDGSAPAPTGKPHP